MSISDEYNVISGIRDLCFNIFANLQLYTFINLSSFNALSINSSQYLSILCYIFYILLVRGLDSFPCAPGCRWMNQGFSYVFLLVESIATGYHCKKVVHFV